MPSTTKMASHDTSLDGLRGLAATIVVIHHYLLGLYPAMVFNKPETIKSPLDTVVATTPLNLLIGGHFAVCIFFILSAHVLTKNHVANAQGVALISVMAKRYPRLGIPVFVSVMISFLALCVKKTFFTSLDVASTATATPAAFDWTTSFKEALFEGVAGAMLFGNAKFNPPLWTLSIEFYGSLGIFALLLILPSGRPTWRWIAYALAILATWKTYYVAFMLGMTLSEFKANPKLISLWLQRHAYLIAPLLIVGLYLGSIPMHHSHWDDTVYQYMDAELWRPTYHIAGAYLIILTIMHSQHIKTILSSRPIKFLGDISFSMYLLHIVIIQYLGHKLIPLLTPHVGFHIATCMAAIPTFGGLLKSAEYFDKLIDKKSMATANKICVNIQRKIVKNHQENDNIKPIQ